MRKKLPKLILFCVPLMLGMIGFVGMAGEPILDSLFNCVCMYAFEYQDPPPNFMVELSRWTALLATASGVLFAFSVVRDWLHGRIHNLLGDSVAVYGPEEERMELLERLGRRGVNGRGRFIPARSYFLVGSEEESLDFYERNRRHLRDKQVYLRCQALPAQSVSDPDLHLFCPEETAARLFWKEHCLYERSIERGHTLKLVFIGFGLLGEQVLTYGLQDNIFDPGQRIEYHIFGDGTRFSATHHELAAISDPVVFHGEPWYEQLPLLEEADALVVLDQVEQLDLVKDLLLTTCRPPLYVFSACGGLDLLDARGRLTLFDWRTAGNDLDTILSDVLFDRAKRINLRYASLYSNVPETEENKETEWVKLDAFTRYSNVSAADYHDVRLLMLKRMGQSPDKLDSECLELLSELEHIRWCRYHQLNNWRHGKPENGNKDRTLRIHVDLIPYDQLTDGEKEKDRENIRVLLGVK